MTRRILTLGLPLAAVVLLGIPSLAHATTTPGEIWVTLKGSDYAKPFLDGSEYEDHEFEDNGFKLVIRLTDIDRAYDFELRPSNPELETGKVHAEKKDFKAKRLKKNEGRMIYAVTVTFVKAKPAQDKPAQEKPAPEPEKPAAVPEPEKPAAAPEPAKPAPAEEK